MFYLSGCGDTAVSTYQKAQTGTSSSGTIINNQTPTTTETETTETEDDIPDNYQVVSPTQPPFIIIDGNIGEIDNNLSKQI